MILKKQELAMVMDICTNRYKKRVSTSNKSKESKQGVSVTDTLSNSSTIILMSKYVVLISDVI